jgi:hypothetical protein
MKTSEKILLVVTIGLGVALGATQVGGAGRRATPPAAPVAGEPAGKQAPAPRARSTLELLASKQAALAPLPTEGRNPFEPDLSEGGVEAVVVGIKVTGILGESDPLTALVTGQIVGKRDPAQGLTLLRVAPGERAVEPLLKGLRVQAGQRIGGLTVVRVTGRGVEFRYDDRTFFIELFNRATAPPGAGSGAGKLAPSATEPSNR